ETQLVHLRVTARAHGIGAVSRHLLAHRENLRRIPFVLQLRDVGGRRRRRRTEDVLQNPLAADHWRRPVRARRVGQNRALTEQAPTRAVGRERDAPESFAVHARDPVVPRQTLVEEGVVGVQQVQHAAVPADDAVEEQRRLVLERLPQVVVEAKQQFRTGPESGRAAGVEPLAAAVGAQRPASICFTCWSRTPGLCSVFFSTMLRSSSSGMLLHRKNDRREASSASVRRYAVPGAAVSGCPSKRNRKLGLTRMLRSASSRPYSKLAGPPPASRTPSRYRAIGIRRSSSVTCRRYACRATFVMMVLAQVASSAGDVGRHSSSRFRLGESEIAVAAEAVGAGIVRLEIPGSPFPAPFGSRAQDRADQTLRHAG